MIRNDLGYRLSELDAVFHDFNRTQITQIIMIKKDLGYRLSELDAVFHDFYRTQITLIIMIKRIRARLLLRSSSQ